jgi:hypothetical protein
MTISNTTALLLSLSGVYKNTFSDGQVSQISWASGQFNWSLATGTDAEETDRLWISKDRTITAGGYETIDVYDFGSIDIGAGAGKDPLGQSLALAEIRGLFIEVADDASYPGSLVVGGEGSGAEWNSLFNGTDGREIIIKPNSLFLALTKNDPGWAVADSTNHLLKMSASGGAVKYSIAIIGTSA